MAIQSSVVKRKKAEPDIIEQPIDKKQETQPSVSIRTHKYAEMAYPLVKAIHETDIESKYRTLALTFPSMIMQSGLAQAVGFFMAKDKAEHKKILSHLAKLLNKDSSEMLHKKILESNITEYQLMSRNAIEASSWLKRYTQALLEKNKGEESV